MSTIAVTSEAYNLSSISSSVNDRTGGVVVSVSLGQISSGLQDRVAFNLTISSNPGNPGNNKYGFGGNWLINSPRIDFNNRTIYFGDGKSAQYTGNFVLEYHRVKDIKIEKKRIVDGSISYWNTVIAYKNGTVEYYNELGAITKLVSASGHSLNFTYESQPGEAYQVLSKINDGYGNELAIDYGVAPPGSMVRVVTVTQFSAGERSTTKVYIQRNINQDIVKSISLPNNSDQRFQFEYTAKKDGLVYLSKIIKPTGQVQVFTYKEISYNGSQTINVVSKLVTMGNDPALSNKATVVYEYSDKNFTGYPLVTTQMPGRDNCIYRRDDFNYTVTEVHDDIKIKRTFNRFHLTVEEEYIDALTSTRHSLTTFTYPVVKNQDINGQPANLSFWTKKSTVYSDSSNAQREIYETRSFDVFGNLLSHREVSGLTTNNIYYPADSTLEDGCPPTQNEYFACHLKRSEIKSESSSDEMKTLEIKYKKIQGLSYTSPILSTPPTTITPYMVRAVESKTNGIILSTADYVSATNDTDENARIFVGMQLWEKHPSDSTPYTISYTYTKVNSLAKIDTSHRSIDAGGALEKNTSKIFSLSSGLTYTEEDFNGAITNYQYDAENRLIKETNFCGTDWQREKKYSYEYYRHIDSTYGYQNIVKATNSSGMQFTSYINFNNQLSYALETFPDGVEFCVKKLQYFASGLISSETEYDKVLIPSGAEILVSNTTKYIYDSKELVKINHPDGTTSTIKRNKVLNTEDHQQPSGAIYRKTFDSTGKVTSLSVITNHGNNHVLCPIEQTTYDHFGRKVETINRTGGRSNFEYDQFDRLIKETVHDSDGRGRVDCNTYTYDSALQNMNLSASVTSTTSLNTQQEVVLESRQSYDGFGRLIQQDDQTFSYAQPYYKLPSSSNIADEARISTIFNSTTLSTDEIVKTLSKAPDIKFKYIYNKRTGSIIQAHAYRSDLETAKFEYTYNAKGALTKTCCTYGTGTSTTTEKTYSAKGDRVMIATNHLGKQQSYHYDHYGRLWVKKYGDLDILIGAAYDRNGALSSIRVQSSKFSGANEEFAILSFEYDTSNFESRRSLAIRKNETMSVILDVHIEYGNNELIISRQLSKGENATDNIYQTFTYLGAYGHLHSSTTTKGTTTPSVTNYNFAGGQRFSTIEITNQNTQEYSYHGDRVSKINDGGRFVNFNVDFMGNLTNGPETGADTRFFKYDAANSVTSCDVYNENVVFDYLYDPFGKTSQILKGSENITYVYDGDMVVGEISGDTKTLYLSFGDVIIGRYLLRGEREELELFGTDNAGTVRCVTKCLPGGNIVETIYHDYSDFGESREW